MRQKRNKHQAQSPLAITNSETGEVVKYEGIYPVVPAWHASRALRRGGFAKLLRRGMRPEPSYLLSCLVARLNPPPSVIYVDTAGNARVG